MAFFMPLVGVKKAVDWRQAKPVTKLCEHTPADFLYTIAAIKEVQELKKAPNKKTYDCFSELLEDLDS